MKTTIVSIIVLFGLFTSGKGQNTTNDTVLIYRFSDAFSLMVSDDESRVAVIICNNRIEVYDLDSMSFVSSHKVSRNAWLTKAFFYDHNNILYFDYGTQVKFRYRKLNIITGKNVKVKCGDVPKGCGYTSLKYCGLYNPVLELKRRNLVFKVNDMDIEVYHVEQGRNQ